MRESAWGAAREIAIFIRELRRSVHLFAIGERDLIAQIAADPDLDGKPYKRLQKKLRIHFPEIFAFTVADAEGTPLLEDFEGLVSELCQADIRKFVRNGQKSNVTLHPATAAYHFDIMAPWHTAEGQGGVFFVSFYPRELARLLANHQLARHRLLLIRSDKPTLIEITAEGARDKLKGAFHLDEETLQSSVLESVPGTGWQLIVLLDQQLLRNELRHILSEVAIILGGFIPISWLALWLIKRALRQRAVAERTAVQSQRQVQELRQTQDALQESEKRYHLATNAGQVGVWDCDLVTDSLYVDSSLKAMLGYSAGDPGNAPNHWAQCIYKDDIGAVKASVKTHIRTRTPQFEIEHRMLCKDGSARWFLTRGSAIRNTRRKTYRLTGTSTDITTRKQAEQELFEAKERAQVTLHSIGDGVIATDARNSVQYLNPVAERLTGWDASDAQGQPLEAVFHRVNERSREPAPLAGTARTPDQASVNGIHEAILISRSGEEYPIQDSVAPIHSRQGEVLGRVIVFSDATQARRLTQQIAHQARHDALTGLINRGEFDRRLEHAVASSREYGTYHALCYLDLDQFKIVNDTAGHTAGDQLLRQVATLLAHEVRERDTLARLGGDEFGLVLDNCPLDKAFAIAETLVAAIGEFRFVWEGRVFQIGVSIGLVPITAEAESSGQVLSQADVACYTAKDLGRNRVYVYQQRHGKLARRHTEILRAAELRQALEEQRFRLYYQPIVPISADHASVNHYELLLRLLDVHGDIVLPGAFIPAAERYGLMGTIDRWVVQNALQDYPEIFAVESKPLIAINLSGNSLNDDSLLEFVHQQFTTSRVSPEQVCFEITETAAVHNLSQAIRFITEMKKSGCRFALDDFGSGVSSFAYLKRLPVDYLKIDGSFIRDMLEDPIDHAMVAAINRIGHIMVIKTVAEYVDSEATVEQLRMLGVDYAQGYLLGVPKPLHDLLAKRTLS